MWYTTARDLLQFVLQVQISIDRVGYFSLVTKLGHKYKKFNFAILNHKSTDTKSGFISTMWSYDHEVSHIFQVETHAQLINNHENIDTMGHTTSFSASFVEKELDLESRVPMQQNYLASQQHLQRTSHS